MDYEQILVEDRGEVRLITLNRPEKLNAWTRRMSRELTDAIVDGNGDDQIGAFVFTGSGRAFCAGADIGGEFAKNDDEPAKPPSDRSAGSDDPSDWVALCRASKPMVAAINGPSVGVGLTLVLPMDQLIASDTAKLSARFVRMGLVPELASSHFLVQRCGWGAASDLALSGRMVMADEAGRLGLVDSVVGADELLDTAIATAASYAGNPPWAVRTIKELLTLNGSEGDVATVQRREMERLQEAYQTAEHKEAVAAFLEKREPRFR
ncbi:MAG: enoyl-CoA hydratase/isomerase family protein [Acidimicrobiales bacterium]